MRSLLFLCIFVAWTQYAMAKPLLVVTSISPITAIARAVGGPYVKVLTFSEDTESPHFIKIRPRFKAVVLQADLIVTVGENLECFLDVALRKLCTPHQWTRLTSLRELQYYKVSLTTTHIDPHLWLSPFNGKRIAMWFAGQYARKRPHLAHIFDDRAKKLIQEISNVDKKNKKMLSPHKNKHFIVLHDGYQYFERHYELCQKEVVVANGEVSCRPRHLQKIIDDIKNVKCVFDEKQSPSPFSKKIKQLTRAHVVLLDPLNSNQGYPTLLSKLAQDMVSCFKYTNFQSKHRFLGKKFDSETTLAQ